VEAGFTDWSIEDRYRDGSAIASEKVERRRELSTKVLSMHEETVITGRPPSP